MFDVICVTNRKLCHGEFLERMEAAVREKPKAVLLREKDLTEQEYEILAKAVQEICKAYHVPCILHSFVNAALRLNAEAFHAPLSVIREMQAEEKMQFRQLGASCHSLSDALEAQKLGCTYLTAGHIFATDCKKGVPPRGLDFLAEICRFVSIPVYAIGGIDRENASFAREVGAAGVCVMSGWMECESVHTYMEGFRVE